MAKHDLGGRASPVTFPEQLSPKERLLFLLHGVSTMDQWEAWVEDFKTGARLVSYDDRVELACYGGMRRVDIEHGEPLREFS